MKELLHSSPDAIKTDQEKNKKMKKKQNRSDQTNLSKMESAATGFGSISDDIVQNILSRLPAQSFSYASCVSRSWNGVCNRILARPKLRSAMSLNPNARSALEEVFDEVLSEPIRPDFVIVNVTGQVDLQEASDFIPERIGRRVPTIVTRSGGVIGKEVRNYKFREVKFGDVLDGDTDVTSSGLNSVILLTIGYVPGLKVDVVPLLPSKKEPQMAMIDKFVMGIRDYTASVSNQKGPACIILFGDGDCDQEPVVQKLDCAMPAETIILGDERGEFLYRSCCDSRDASRALRYTAALVFARDRNRLQGAGDIQFHTLLSRGVSAVGPKYKAASVLISDSDCATFLTARREGQREILDGEQILDAVNDELADNIVCPNLYLGVTKRRNCSIGSEKPKPMTSLAFHEVLGGDEHNLRVDGFGIKTGDQFQFFHSDPKAAVASTNSASSKLRNLLAGWNSSGDLSAFGGLIFACCGRGAKFFGRSNVDSSPFLENFSQVPFSGVFCGGEIGRGFFDAEESRGDESSAR